MRFAALLAAVALAVAPIPQGGQATVVRHGSSLPSVCTANQDLFIRDSVGPYWCSAANTWSLIGEPAGLIGMVETGTCPTGYTQVTSIDGRMALATLAAHGDVGTTGGSDNITPAGTNSAPVFTGNLEDTTDVSAGTPAGTNSAATFTGNGAVLTGTVSQPTFAGDAVTAASTAATPDLVAADVTGAGVSPVTTATGTVSQPTLSMDSYTPTGTNSAATFTGNALPTHEHEVTATGTNSAPTFTGTQFDNRSGFMRVIFCKKA